MPPTLRQRTKTIATASTSTAIGDIMDDTILSGSEDEEDSDIPNLAAKVKRRTKKAPDEYNYTSEYESGLEDSSEPSKKRSRTSAEDGASRNKRGKGKRAAAKELMKTFCDILPLDVVYEIFGYLHPRDLLILARSNKTLRVLLMRRSAISVWTAAFSTVEDVPKWPPDQSPMQWTQLIFFTDCMICWGQNKIRNIDWAARLRGCELCLKQNFIRGTQIPKRFKQYQLEEVQDALALLPYTENTSWVGSAPPGSLLYYRPAVGSMLQTLDGYKVKARERLDGAQTELEAFKSQKAKEAKEIIDSALELQEWIETHRWEKATTKEEISRARVAAVRTKLLELGHDKRDIEVMTWSIKTGGPLTERSWKTCRARYVKLVEDCKRMRLTMEFKNLVTRRKSLVAVLYSDYKAQLDTPVDPLTPRFHTAICDFTPFKRVLESDVEITVTEESFSAAMEQLPALLEEWANERKMILLEKLAKALATPTLPTLDTMNKAQANEQFAKLDKLTSAFVCKHASIGEGSILYVSGLRQHNCPKHPRWERPQTEPMSECFTVDLEVVKAVGVLAKLVGLDPEIATPKEMDNINARFYCKQCPLYGEMGRCARSWRQCATHHLSHSGIRPIQGWARLVEKDEKAVIAIENDNIADPTSRIICHHCCEDEYRTSHSQLKYHMERRHGKKTIDPSDYHADPTIPAQPVALPLQTTASSAEISPSGLLTM